MRDCRANSSGDLGLPQRAIHSGDATSINGVSPIRELEAHNQQLGERIAQLGEQFRLAQSSRFAPSSGKLRDRLFDEAEQAAIAEPDDADSV